MTILIVKTLTGKEIEFSGIDLDRPYQHGDSAAAAADDDINNNNILAVENVPLAEGAVLENNTCINASETSSSDDNNDDNNLSVDSVPLADLKIGNSGSSSRRCISVLDLKNMVEEQEGSVLPEFQIRFS